jgi:excisionase family DNA binding protein
MDASGTDFINLSVFAKTVADELNESFISRGFAGRRVVTLNEAAEYCGLTRDSFKNKIVRHRLGKVRFDKYCRFDFADLDAWIDRHKEPIAQETAA